MVQAMFGLRRPARADVLAQLYALTDGNPFFVEEVLKLQGTDGLLLYADLPRHDRALLDFPVPRTVVDAVQRRLQSLSSDARKVLALAAVAGRQFDFEALRSALNRDEDFLLDAMRELVAAQLVVEESADRFAFRHALTRQAVFTDLLARERRALHQTLLTTLEGLAAIGKEPPLADLAYHAFEAGEWSHAISYARRAGDAALRMYAPRAAIVHFTRAIEAAKFGRIPVLLEVFRARAGAFQTVGQFEAALADFEEVLRIARSLGDRQSECQALIDLGFHWSERDYAKTRDYFNSALTLAREIDQPRPLATCLNRIGNWHMNRENPEEALRLHREALALFEAEGDRPGIADTLGLLAITNTVSGNLTESLGWFNRAIDVCRDLGDRAGTSFGLAGSLLCCPLADMDTVVPSLDLVTGIARCEEAIGIARDIGWRGGEVFAGLVLTHGLLARGNFGQALEVGGAALELADDINHHQWLVACRHILGRLFLELFAFARAREVLAPALALARTTDSPFWIHNIVGFLASTLIADGALDEAEAMLDADLPVSSPMIGAGQRTGWCARAELALARHQPNEALRIADRLFDTSGGDERTRPVPCLWHLRAEALIGLHRADDALAALEIARPAASAQFLQPLLWRIDRSRAAAHRARHQYLLADEATVLARSTIDSLAKGILDDSLRSGFLAGSTAKLSPPSAPRVERITHDGLTPRETEVAVLIGSGLTNRLIAEALVLSELTVETHVKRILGKLGVGSRAQVAAWTSRKGLLPPE